MRFLVRDANGCISQLSEEGLSRGLLKLISEEEVEIFRYNLDTKEFEEYHVSDRTFYPMDTYKDEDEDDTPTLEQIAAGLLGSKNPSLRFGV